MNKLEINYVSTDSLRPYAGNARTHSKKQIRQIADSIERFGFGFMTHQLHNGDSA